ncbi:Stromal cell-derived factor 2-like protein 1 [Liparis tanakae]|uniref:Stromal cell-derived factor 2-like protein 1 n=1 Tax=Liparis tanakae TaxID=230148 RepID=A0A4Z2FBJ1_9TELE|nr:Stromal cell-derived factor 2-like protein 1 [Liparis tanakae]
MEVTRAVRALVKSLLLVLLWSQCEGRESELNHVTCGSLLKLLNTRHNVRLHSHDVKYGSGNQLTEVSAFGENGEGDSLDTWTVQCDGDHWERDEAVRFKHVGTDVFLSVTGEQYGHPIRGQREVHGMSAPNQHNWWRSMEGVFLMPSQVPLRHDEL